MPARLRGAAGDIAVKMSRRILSANWRTDCVAKASTGRIVRGPLHRQQEAIIASVHQVFNV